MKKIGAHVSVSGGVEMAPVNALGIGADAFALFTKNQRQWIAKPLSVESVTLFKENCEKESCSIFGRNAALRAFRIENAEFSSRKSFEQDIHREVSGQDCRVCQYDFG